MPLVSADRRGNPQGGAAGAEGRKEHDETLAKVEYLLAVNNVMSPPKDGADKVMEGRGGAAVDEATVAKWDR